MNRTKLSQNFYLDEFTRSETAARHGIIIDVRQNDVEFINLKRLCMFILQPLRNALGLIHVTSGVRPKELNTLIGGSDKSQHISGLAADFVVSGHTPLEVSQWIEKNCPYYDQVIHEFGQWTHASVSALGAPARNTPITAFKRPRLSKKPKTIYIAGLHSIDDALRRLA